MTPYSTCVVKRSLVAYEFVVLDDFIKNTPVHFYKVYYILKSYQATYWSNDIKNRVKITPKTLLDCRVTFT